MKIIMRRVSMIFYFENHGNDNAVRRCLSDKTKWFYQIIVLVGGLAAAYRLYDAAGHAH